MSVVRLTFLCFSLVLLVLVGMGARDAARAEASQSYLIAANDGYGLQDCLAGQSECGQVVADAWCEAHGHAAAVSFGPQSLFSGAASPVSTVAEPYVINCRD